MAARELNVVTGAFSYTGKYIARRLLATGKRVKTLTGHPDRENPFGEQVSVAPLNFGDPEKITKSLQGATTLYNTYWIRFPRGHVTFDTALENTRTLVRAAKEAGVRRIVHISVTNADPGAPLAYYRAKGLVEQAVEESSVSYALVRPPMLFGPADILFNNLAWVLSHMPVFAVPGNGRYRVQPVFVDDVAEIAVSMGQRADNAIVDAAGPDTYTFDSFVRLIADKIGSRAKIIHLPPRLALALSRPMGYLLNDVMLTGDEVKALMANLLVSDGPPTGRTRLSEWLDEHAAILGLEYRSDLKRHFG